MSVDFPYLNGIGVPPPFSLILPPEAAQEKGDLNSYINSSMWIPVDRLT